MLSNSFHILQPLDVGRFAVLKHNYKNLIAKYMRNEPPKVDKIDSLREISLVNYMIFISKTIKKSFSAAGLIPIDADVVLGKLKLGSRRLHRKRSQNSRHLSMRMEFSLKYFYKPSGDLTDSLTSQLCQLYKGFQDVLGKLALACLEIKNLKSALAKKRIKKVLIDEK